MTNELTDEQETVRSVFGAYINDLKAYSLKPDRPTFKRLEEVRDKAIKALEQEDVLDKIRAEIIELRSMQNVGVMECLDIIDKYKAESEVAE